jgi:uncharacterized Ntn-hydrolase superfamily protein
MTFSVVARCAQTGMFGVAISSSSPAVAARCSHTRAKVGAVASQNVTDPTLGPKILDLMAEGASAQQAVAQIRAKTEFIAYRQVLAIDAGGQTAIHSGQNSLGIWADAAGRDAISAGNLLANDGVPAAILEQFETTPGHLGDRLLAAMHAGLVAGGEAGAVHSAGLQICDHVAWPVVDLRCDWTEDCPIAAITGAWEVYKPQIDDYVQRALDPTVAPSYGVPGDS